MTAVELLHAVVGGAGHFCSLALRPSDHSRKQKFFTSINSLLLSAQRMDEEHYDMYFALGTFTEKGNRKAHNVAWMKSLFLDIDSGPGKPYQTQEEALAKLRGFCKHYQLPRPTIVSSGRGLHVYWALTQPIEKHEWQVLASKLAYACTQTGLQVDTTRTEDAASVLRIPGTHNYKDDPAPEVVVLGPLGVPTDVEVLRDLLPMSPLVVTKGAQRAPLPVADDGMANLTGHNRIRLFSIIEEKCQGDRGCAHIKRALEAPADLSYEQWLDVLSVAKFCQDGPEAVHLVSEGYPDYSPEETERIAASISAPHLCVTFDKHTPGLCDECPHRKNAKFTTPILLGSMVQEDTRDVQEVEETDVPEAEFTPQSFTSAAGHHTIPKYPTPYFRGVAGGVFIRTKDKEGDTVEMQVYRDDIYIVRRLLDPVMGPTYVFRVHTPREGVKDFTIAGTKLTSKEDFRKEMGLHDIFLLRVEELMAYVASWVNQLQQNMDQIPAKLQFGWTSEHMSSFVVGNKEYFPTITTENPPSSATAQHFATFEPKGSLAEWKKTLDFYNVEGMEPYQYMVGTAFGSVLMAFTPIAGSIFHMHSPKSGFGKTACMLAAASVWGNPTRMVMKAKDTTNSQWMRAETFKNLPLYVDELTNIQPKDASDFAYSVTDANQKARMRNSSENLERVRGAPWSLIIGTTANESLLEKMSAWKALPDGESQRVLEHRVNQTFYTVDDKKRTDEFSASLLHNYGHAGPVFIQYVMSNLDEVKRLLKKVQMTIDSVTQMSSSNRIWSAQAACVVTGLYIAKRLGLVNYDIQAVLNWITLLIHNARTVFNTQNRTPTEYVAQYYAEMYQGILRIRSTDTGHKLNNSGLDALVVPDLSPKTQLVIRHETDTKKLYLLIAPFKAWCAKHHIGYSDLIEKLEQGPHKLKSQPVRIGKGTRMAMPAVRALILHWSDDDTPEIPVDADE